MQVVIVDKPKRVETILKKHSDYPHLRVVVIMEEFTDCLKDRAANEGVSLFTFHQAEKLGSTVEQAWSSMPPLPEYLSTICYTSGTTGLPKGAMITHANIVANCSGMVICKYVFPSKDDVLISYLPLAHMFERVLEQTIMMVGGRIGFYRGSIRMLADDIQELKPTIMPTVPRLLNCIHDRTIAKATSNFLRRWIWRNAMRYKNVDLKNGVIRTNLWWDYLVFNKIRQKFGGRLKLVITGSAPCSPEVLTFIRIVLGCVILEGYGQAESVVAVSATMIGDHNPGHIGPPLPCCQVKLADVPELNYYAKDGYGELCVAGPIVFKGYYTDEAKTAQVLDKDGWLHTGDIGFWTTQGTLKLIDRKKHIFKLSQGEYVAPEKVENVYNCSKFVQQSFVYGEGLKPFLVAIIVPDMEILVVEAKQRFKLTGSPEALCQDDESLWTLILRDVNMMCMKNIRMIYANFRPLKLDFTAMNLRQLILDDMNQVAQEAGLNSYEMVKAIYLSAEPFSIDNSLLTPTLKSKRRALKEHFAHQLSRMYINIPPKNGRPNSKRYDSAASKEIS